MKFPSSEGELHVFTDASSTAIGVHFAQVEKGETKPITFASRKLTSAESNYSTIDREMLAIVWAQDGYHILMEFNITVDHIPGKLNNVADTLSRTCSSAQLDLGINILDWQTSDAFFTLFTSSWTLGALHTQLIGSILSKNYGIALVPESKIIESATKIRRTDHGHAGITKPLELNQRCFFWLKISETVEKVVARCEICGQNKLTNPKPRHHIQPIPLNEAFSYGHVDFAGPLPETSSGNRYFIIFIDRLTKWVQAFTCLIKQQNRAQESLLTRLFADLAYLNPYIQIRVANSIHFYFNTSAKPSE
ncbi:hypothetical protein RF11_00070 [Thelohanellus kitauei]|uniref:Uncharacterized protein n=1 Tax=Thelohanellus kitauei TaxID=669202 RepID=A0A0C2J8F0_THEKT|nr:hypothetical protein RF11_00070 [Thelohanellus kitauei]